MGARTEPAPLGKHFLLLVKNGGSFIFVRLMGSYPVFSGWILASSPAPGDPCPVCRHLVGTAFGGSRVGERVRRTQYGEARSPREARVGRAEAGGGQRLCTRAQPVPRAAGEPRGSAPRGPECGPAGSRPPRLRPASVPSQRCGATLNADTSWSGPTVALLRTGGRERGRSPPASSPARLESSDGQLQPKDTGRAQLRGNRRLLAKHA